MRPCPLCNGTGKKWGVYLDPCPLCRGESQIPNSEPGQIPCHWCNGNGREHGVDLKLCKWCEGTGYRFPKTDDAETPEGPLVFFFGTGKPRTAHLTLLSLLTPLEGDIRICDPYYGTGSLLRLDPIADRPIRLLTRNADSIEKSSGILDRALTEFVKEHPSVEFRRHAQNDLHDRFILASSQLILLGLGLKDIGNKDSFIVRLNRDVASDTIDQVTASFDTKWNNAAGLP